MEDEGGFSEFCGDHRYGRYREIVSSKHSPSLSRACDNSKSRRSSPKGTRFCYYPGGFPQTGQNFSLTLFFQTQMRFSWKASKIACLIGICQPGADFLFLFSALQPPSVLRQYGTTWKAAAKNVSLPSVNVQLLSFELFSLFSSRWLRRFRRRTTRGAWPCLQDVRDFQTIMFF